VNPDGPLIVQSDRTVLLEVHHALADSARHALAVFAELERAPEHMHTYRITRLGLWNARAAGHTSEEILGTLEEYSKFPLPQGIAEEITDTIGRYGLKLRVTAMTSSSLVTPQQSKRKSHERRKSRTSSASATTKVAIR